MAIVTTKSNSNDNAAGISYMLLAMLSLATMDAMAKLLIKDNIDPVQILAIRSWIILTILISYYYFRKQLNQLYTRRPIALILRGCVGFLAAYCFFKSLVVLPLADATVVFFSSTLIVTALSALVLKETVGVYRWLAVSIGFVGVIIAMEPKGEGTLMSYMLCFFGSFCYAIYFISSRWLSSTESVPSMVFSFNLCMAIICSSLASFVWVPFAQIDLTALLLFTALALIGHVSVTISFTKADVSVIAPFEYTALLWAIFWGYTLWGEVPEPRVLIGGAIIISCALVVIHRESKHSKKALSQPTNIDLNP